MHLGLVVPLPPTPAGAAEWVAGSLDILEKHATVTCFVPDPELVDEKVRNAHNVRPLSERDDPSVDMLIYHIANNPHHAFVLDALIEGPAGLVEVHDGSLHHYLQTATLGSEKPFEYITLGASAHGWSGKRVAEMRTRRYRGTVELFLYDYLQPALDRARGVIVHSAYAEQLVQLRCPRVHTWVVPLHAPDFGDPPTDRAWTGISEDTLLIANLGFVTAPKRPFTTLEALRAVLDRGLDAHAVYVGRDETRGELQHMIEELDLIDKVTITGYIDTDEMEAWVQAVDVIVNLRAPHVGESSASLAYGLAAAKPVIVQPIGSWAELPADTVVRLPVTADDSAALAASIFALGQDSSLRRGVGERARAYAQTALDADTCSELLVHAAKAAIDSDWVPPSWFSGGYAAGAATFLTSGATRINALLQEGSNCPGAASAEALERIVPARPHAKLLAIDVPPRLVQVLAKVWGYEPEARTWKAKSETVVLDARPGLPAFTFELKPMTGMDLPLDTYDSIIMAGAEDITAALEAAHLALTPQGMCVVLDRKLDSETLDHFGFSDHLHFDHPGFVMKPKSDAEHITAATKALLPANF